jgi:hypothetical protein
MDQKNPWIMRQKKKKSLVLKQIPYLKQIAPYF